MAKEKLRFMTEEQVRQIADEFGTPTFVYSERLLTKHAKEVLDFPNAFGLNVRFAMKSSPNKNILNLFNRLGIQIDASSEYEVLRAIDAGIPPQNIMLTAQQFADEHRLKEFIGKGVKFNACSLHQLENYGRLFPDTKVCIRINPGLGTGHSNKTNVGGPSSSFGIWHEYMDKVKDIANNYNLKITKVHTHVGSGGDPQVWKKIAIMNLKYVDMFPDVITLNMGGGFKVGRMEGEKTTDLQLIGKPVKEAIEKFAKDTGRKINFEIEPGTYLVANSASVISKVIDIVDTGDSDESYSFLKVDSGMTEVTRPSLYAAQHPLVVVPREEKETQGNEQREDKEYLVSGHCCESGDIWTPADDDPEGLKPRLLTQARIGDYVVCEGSGAYCSAMSTKNYNSFPEAAEVLLKEDGSFKLIRKRQLPKEVWKNEL